MLAKISQRSAMLLQNGTNSYSTCVALCDAPISGGLVDNPSTRGISVLGRLAPKSWYRIGTNYPWTSSYSVPLPYVPSRGPIHSYLNLKYEKKMNNYSP